MAVSNLHIFRQGPVIQGLLRAGWSAISGPSSPAVPPLPGPELHVTVPPRNAALVHDFIQWAGGDPRAWSGQVPPTLFPQWGFPLLGRTLSDIPYPLARVLNQGCRIAVQRDIPAGEALQLRAQLVAIEETESKARIHQQLITGTVSVPDALICDVYSVVPLDSGKGGPKGPRRPKPTVDWSLRELGRRHVGPSVGLDFARLTGDFNPVHWVGAYARMAGFRTPILHGFATISIAVETVIRSVWSGDVSRFGGLDVRLTRPLLLGRGVDLGVFVGEAGPDGTRTLAVGAGHGGPAWMLGTIRDRSLADSEGATHG